MGAWIEMSKEGRRKLLEQVAPFMGAWIEIVICTANSSDIWSLPSWERGLK